MPITDFQTNAGYSNCNKARLVQSGKTFFDLVSQLIVSAKQNVFLQFYIFLNDETGIAVIEALKEATKRGVLVYLYIDSYASKELPETCISEMKEAGINLKLFEPLLRSKHFYFGRRLHHKVVVVDGIYSLVGGINICNRYNDMPGEPAWLDMALFCEGEISSKVQDICVKMWNSKNKLPSIKNPQIATKSKPGESIMVKVSRNDWVKGKKEVWTSYLEMFTNAEKSITIMCSYFLPGKLFRQKLAAAARRGVSVKIILAGISDIMLAKQAERYLYQWMLRNDISIYEYKETVLHAKIAVYDSCRVTIGSYNVNGLSAHASLEMNMDVQDVGFASNTEKQLDAIISKHCEQVTKENYSSSTNIFRQFWQWACYNVINKMLFLATFYFRQEK
jgi:cardiolipin synthase A/B